MSLTYMLMHCLPTGISEVPDIKFIGNSSRVSEDEGTVTVCAVSGKLAEEFTPFTVTISTVPNTVKGCNEFRAVTNNQYIE